MKQPRFTRRNDTPSVFVPKFSALNDSTDTPTDTSQYDGPSACVSGVSLPLSEVKLAYLLLTPVRF